MRRPYTWFSIPTLAVLIAFPAMPQSQRSIEKVLFENAHIRFIEVTNWPGKSHIGAVPYSSVLMTDADWPTLQETPTDPLAAKNENHSDKVVPRDNRPYPWCRTQTPLAARTVTVQSDFPQHYYRIDYKRVDGKDYGAHWQSWYADVFAPPAKIVPDPGKSLQSGKPFSKEWPYDAGYNATEAAPANHTLRYDDDHVQLLEVAIRTGEKENMHGHPYPSVFADDGGFAPEGEVTTNASLVPVPGPPWGKMSTGPRGEDFPICFSAVPEPPHEVTVKEGPPEHFYRVHFKRIDGDDIKTRWRQWYPVPR